MPLSTLHARPYGRSYMTQGRCDWLGLHRTTLAFATPHRFIPALLPLLREPRLWLPVSGRGAKARPRPLRRPGLLAAHELQRPSAPHSPDPARLPGVV